MTFLLSFGIELSRLAAIDCAICFCLRYNFVKEGLTLLTVLFLHFLELLFQPTLLLPYLFNFNAGHLQFFDVG